MEGQLEVAGVIGVKHRRARRRTVGAMLFEAQMTDVASFEFVSGGVDLLSCPRPARSLKS
jgi:hypothetical protein